MSAPPTMWIYPTIPLIAFAVSFLLTPLAKRLRPRLGAMDMPNPLSIHSTPTPRTGGLAIFAGFLIAVSYSAVITRAHTPMLLGILAAAGIVALVGVARFSMGKRAGRWERERYPDVQGSG